MRKLFTILTAVCLFGVYSATAQCVPDFTMTTPTLKPNSDSLACAVQGSPYTATIFFKNFTSVSGFNVDSLRIDSLVNAPSGLCYSCNKTKRVYLNGEQGCINVFGSTSDAAGQYQLGIFITVWATPDLPGVEGISVPAATLAGLGGLDFRYWLRVKTSTGSCAPVDTNRGSTANLTSSNPSSCDRTAVEDVKNDITTFEIAPNPASSSATVSFNSDVTGQFQTVVTNVLGEVVSTSSIVANRGENRINLNVSDMETGIYFFSIRDGKNVVTKRFVVSK